MANICFDGNYLLMKNVMTLHKMNRLYGDLWTSLDNNISKYTSMNKWDNVIFVSDSRKKSWRKKFLDNYKGTRTPVEGIDWKWVFEQYTAWKEENRSKFLIVEGDHIEGDDWISSILLKTNKQGQSNVVISSDGDMPQLLGFKLNGDKSWINIQINDIMGREKVIIPIGWQLWMKEFDENTGGDIFNLDNGLDFISFFNKITSHWLVEEINPKQKLFVKLVQGDTSDNIKSIYEKLTKTGKIQGIGKAGAEKIWNFYKDNYKDYFNTKDPEFISEVINCVEKVNGITMDDDKYDQVTSNIIRNIKLIELHYRHLPDWVVEQIIGELDEKI